jgi:hypothetical protein
MTSFTKALYRRDPAAAQAFYRQQQFEQKLTYGKHTQLACFTPATAPTVKQFGQRTPSGLVGCAQLCSHPACSQGCTLVGRR